MPNHDKIAIFEKELVETLKQVLGGKDTIIKIRRKDSDRNEFVGDANKALDYCLEKGGYSVEKFKHTTK